MSLFKNPYMHIAFYGIAFIMLIGSHRVAPTNLAGPGLDAWVVLFMLIGMTALFFGGLTQTDALKNRLWIIVIHACGAGVLGYLLLQ